MNWTFSFSTIAGEVTAPIAALCRVSTMAFGTPVGAKSASNCDLSP